MPLHVSEEIRQNLLEVHVTGKLGREDYEKFVPYTERLIKQYGKIRVLMVMRALCGRTSSGMRSISIRSNVWEW